MILSFNDTAPQYGGRVDGSVILRSGTRGVARTRCRPANTRQRQRWVPPWSFAQASDAWANLATEVQENWADTAAAFSAWPIQGSPRFTDGKTFFQNFFTVLLLVDEFASVPDPPEEEPDWQERPKWFPFAEWVYGYYTLKAETEFAENTHLLFSGLPPSPTVFNGEWFGEKIIGNEIFDWGLYPNEEWDGIHTMIENSFGAIDDSMKIWGRVWEIYPDTGFIRVLKDPCTPTPTAAVGQEWLDIIIYNDWSSDTDEATFYCIDSEEAIIGSIDLGYIEAEDYAEDFISLDFEKTTADIDHIEFVIRWWDGEQANGTLDYGGELVFEASLYPGM